MTARTIEAVVDVGEDRKLILQLPEDVSVGRHRVVATVDESLEQPESATGKSWSFPVLENAQWPADMPMTREEMYGDDGR